jgi:hypothetical protein
MKQRIAAVAASALTAGFLSVVSMPAANAAEGVATADAGSTQVLVAVTGSAGAKTATMIVTGQLSLDIDGGSETTDTIITVSGGTITGISSSSVGCTVQTATQAKLVDDTESAGTSACTDIKFKPNAAGTNMTISTYVGSSDLAAGTRTDKITVTVVSAGVVGVFNAGLSKISMNDDDSATATAADTVYANIVANGNEGRINYELNDGLGSDLPVSTTVSAAVTSGNCVISGTSGAATIPSVSLTAPDADIFVAQNAASEDLSTTCAVALSVNGAVVATKTFLFQGAVTSIVVSDVEIADSGASAQTGLANVVAKDAAGNTLGGITLAEGNGANQIVSSITFSDASSMTSSGSTTVNLADTSHSAAPGSTPTSIGWTCSNVKGSAPMTVKYAVGNGTFIHSNIFTAACYGDAVNYSASLDKASYVPGDIATLTITATDSSKNAANDQEVMGTAGSADVAIAGSNMTAITAPTNADKFTAGKKTYKFIVGSSEGSYQMSVDLPKFNSTTYSQAAVTAAYKIAASTATVSNADVLKSIVALIASINKQIQALQKLILKR